MLRGRWTKRKRKEIPRNNQSSLHPKIAGKKPRPISHQFQSSSAHGMQSTHLHIHGHESETQLGDAASRQETRPWSIGRIQRLPEHTNVIIRNRTNQAVRLILGRTPHCTKNRNLHSAALRNPVEGRGKYLPVCVCVCVTNSHADEEASRPIDKRRARALRDSISPKNRTREGRSERMRERE